MHNSTVPLPLNTESPNSNPTTMMLQAETGFVSKHNIAPFRCPCPTFIAPMAAKCLRFLVIDKRSNERLADIPLYCKWRRIIRSGTE
ncbi:hypothetical protein TNCV_3514751 [Trichonephila clavipes]|nr:hypothetical protein TNCV_3514751 [Trichonephila clavipes]